VPPRAAGLQAARAAGGVTPKGLLNFLSPQGSGAAGGLRNRPAKRSGDGGDAGARGCTGRAAVVPRTSGGRSGDFITAVGGRPGSRVRSAPSHALFGGDHRSRPARPRQL